MPLNPTRPSLNSFKKKLVIACLSVGLIPLIAVSFLYWNLLNQRIMKDSESSSMEMLRYLSASIDRQTDTAEQLLGWITYNQKLQDILTTSYEKTYEKQLEIIEFSSYVTEYAINANMESNILKILILDEQGNSFQMGNGYSLLRDQEVVAAGWLETYQKRQADELVLSMDWYLKDTFVFPMSSRIYDNLSGKPIGWCLVLFEQSMYTDYLVSSEGETLFIVNQNGQCIASAAQELLGTNLSENKMISEVLASGQSVGQVTGDYNGEPAIMHYYRIPNTNMIEIQGVSLQDYMQEKKEMTRLATLFILVTTTAILLSVLYLSNLLMSPINTISAYIKKVPDSNFKGTLALKSDDEFQKIAESINTMEQEIWKLMEKQQKEADIKKQLEFQVLQNQINPHFLYNTLNSIKWMATLQHADTIRDMTAALGRLLQNISKGTDSKIPIYEEMSLLDDYVLIQDIRYNGKIQVEYHIGSGEITQAYIVKFLLQPIVENAIFHGIEPKDGIGTIDIYLDREDNDISIRIIDDGIGMTTEQIDDLLNPEKGRGNERGLNGIGVSNINERVKMTYGDKYGINITSKLGEYTEVTIRIPYEKEGAEIENNHNH